jgi:hypothetical protein
VRSAIQYLDLLQGRGIGLKCRLAE